MKIPFSGNAPFPYKKIAAQSHCDAILIQIGGSTVLWEDDCACTASFLTDALVRELPGKGPDYILLSHSHYDHAGGTPFLKAAFPEATVIAHTHAAKVFRKESTRLAMLRMDDALADLRGLPRADRAIFHTIHADIAVKDGDTISIGGSRIIICEVPGHTRDSVCYYFPEEKLLLGSETLGVCEPDYSEDGRPVYSRIAMPMLLGHEMVCASLRKAASLPVETMMLPHGLGVIYGKENCAAYFQAALRRANEIKDLILSACSEEKTSDEIYADAVRLVENTDDYYDASMVRARHLNASIMVRSILQEA